MPARGGCQTTAKLTANAINGVLGICLQVDYGDHRIVALKPLPQAMRPDSKLHPYRPKCYHRSVFNFGKPKSASDWIAHAILGVVALFLIWWMMHMFF